MPSFAPVMKVGRLTWLISPLLPVTPTITRVISGAAWAGGTAAGGIPRALLIISTKLKRISQIGIGCNRGFNLLSVPLLRVEKIADHVRMFARKPSSTMGKCNARGSIYKDVATLQTSLEGTWLSC